MSSAKGKFGKFFTLLILTDCSKNSEPIDAKRELQKGNYDFIDPVYELFVKKASGAVGTQPSKTSIGVQIFVRESDLRHNEYERRLCQWASFFSKALQGVAASRVKFFELRPYSFAPI